MIKCTCFCPAPVLVCSECTGVDPEAAAKTWKDVNEQKDLMQRLTEIRPGSQQCSSRL